MPAKAKPAKLADLAGATSAPPAGKEAEAPVQTAGGFVIEAFSVTGDGTDYTIVENGRGRTILAAQADAVILESPPPSGPGRWRVQLQPGKFRYL